MQACVTQPTVIVMKSDCSQSMSRRSTSRIVFSGERERSYRLPTADSEVSMILRSETNQNSQFWGVLA